MVSRSAGTSIRHSDRTTQTSRSAKTTAFPSVSRKSRNASSDGVATLKRFAHQAGSSDAGSAQLALYRRESTKLDYRARWGKQLCQPSRATDPCFTPALSSVYRRFRHHLFSGISSVPSRSQLLVQHIGRLHGIWTRYWSTCHDPRSSP